MAAVILFQGFEGFTDGSLERNLLLLVASIQRLYQANLEQCVLRIRIVINMEILAKAYTSLSSDHCREMPSAGELEVLSTTKFVGSKVEPSSRVYTCWEEALPGDIPIKDDCTQFHLKC